MMRGWLMVHHVDQSVLPQAGMMRDRRGARGYDPRSRLINHTPCRKSGGKARSLGLAEGADVIGPSPHPLTSTSASSTAATSPMPVTLRRPCLRNPIEASHLALPHL
jgi:hypothetical protein